MVINKFFCGGISKASWHGYLWGSCELYKDGKKIVPSESYRSKKIKLMSMSIWRWEFHFSMFKIDMFYLSPYFKVQNGSNIFLETFQVLF